MTIRQMAFGDLSRVMKIERASFPSPWSTAMFVLEMSRSKSVCLAAEVDGRLAGYVICSCLDLDWHLMSIAVAPEQRRAGIGAGLVGALLEALAEDARLTLEVRPSNAAAIALYERFGFMVAGRRRGYYADTGEDALIMWRTPATLRGSLEDVPNADPSAA
jgi:ribosomal-protein-alanine N-acetyltransferase